MADEKISALPSAGALAGTEPLPIVQGGATKQTTVQDIADLAGTPTLQQVTTAGATTSVGVTVDNGAGESIDVKHDQININTALGTATITSPTLTTATTFELPDKATSPQTFAMIEDITAPDLQQVLDAGNTSTTSLSIDDGAGSSVNVKNSSIDIYNTLGGQATIQSQSLTSTTTFEIPNKAAGTFTFAMTSDIVAGGVPYTGATADVDLGIHSLTADTIGIGVAAGAEKLHIDGGATTTRLKIDADNGVSRILSFRTDDVQRWALRVDGTETGTNSGGDFQLRRYTDAGVYIDSPIAINRANGNITTAQNINGATPTELGYLSGVGSQVVGTTDTNILTNKRITARTGTVASSATPTINTDNVDYYSITALAAAITSFTTNLSGVPTIGQTLWISIKDNGTARAIAWGASFEHQQ